MGCAECGGPTDYEEREEELVSLRAKLDCALKENELLQKRDVLADLYVNMCKSIKPMEREIEHLKAQLNARPDTSALAALRALVDEQANDESLWSIRLDGSQPITEAYLQQELRKIHFAAEAACAEKDCHQSVTKASQAESAKARDPRCTCGMGQAAGRCPLHDPVLTGSQTAKEPPRG